MVLKIAPRCTHICTLENPKNYTPLARMGSKLFIMSDLLLGAGAGTRTSGGRVRGDRGPAEASSVVGGRVELGAGAGTRTRKPCGGGF